jgi:hypothetical protein
VQAWLLHLYIDAMGEGLRMDGQVQIASAPRALDAYSRGREPQTNIRCEEVIVGRDKLASCISQLNTHNDVKRSKTQLANHATLQEWSAFDQSSWLTAKFYAGEDATANC